jgi:hypothetical protein
VDVLGRECGLGLGGLADRFSKIATAGNASVKDARLVQMQVRFDKSRRNQMAPDIDRLTLGFKGRCDGRNLSRCRDAPRCRAERSSG